MTYAEPLSHFFSSVLADKCQAFVFPMSAVPVQTEHPLPDRIIVIVPTCERPDDDLSFISDLTVSAIAFAKIHINNFCAKIHFTEIIVQLSLHMTK